MNTECDTAPSTAALHFSSASLAPTEPDASPWTEVSVPQRRVLDYVDLSAVAPVAHGNERHIYPHPHDSSLLIKVVNTERRSLSQKAHRIKRWYRRFHRESSYRVFITELSEYISTSVQSPFSGTRVPMARIVGLVDTSMGMGLLVEKITGEDGKVAPTLAHLMRSEGWNDAWEYHLNRFFLDLADHHVIFNDVGPQNIVFGRNAAGVKGLYLIDGFGSKQAIPVFAWSKRLNQRRLTRKYSELLARLKREYAPLSAPPAGTDGALSPVRTVVAQSEIQMSHGPVPSRAPSALSQPR